LIFVRYLYVVEPGSLHFRKDPEAEKESEPSIDLRSIRRFTLVDEKSDKFGPRLIIEIPSSVDVRLRFNSAEDVGIWKTGLEEWKKYADEHRKFNTATSLTVLQLSYLMTLKPGHHLLQHLVVNIAVELRVCIIHCHHGIRRRTTNQKMINNNYFQSQSKTKTRSKQNQRKRVVDFYPFSVEKINIILFQPTLVSKTKKSPRQYHLFMTPLFVVRQLLSNLEPRLELFNPVKTQ
jgi:hypothetical protein